ncbi:MAG: exo-alpha-sialidase, partial [Phycisphaerales bacterium]
MAMPLHLRRSTPARLASLLLAVATGAAHAAPPVPQFDLSRDTARQVVVDREAGQYLGHPT